MEIEVYSENAFSAFPKDTLYNLAPLSAIQEIMNEFFSSSIFMLLPHQKDFFDYYYVSSIVY